MRDKVLFLIVGLVIGFLAGILLGILGGGFTGSKWNLISTTPSAKGSKGPGQPIMDEMTREEAPAGETMPLEQKKQLEEMRQTIAKLQDELQKDPDDPKLNLSIANLYYDSRDYQNAIRHYEKVLVKEPRNVAAMVDMYTAYWYLGDIDRAIEGLKAALALDPEYPMALYNLGIILLHGKEDLRGAKEYWTRLLQTRTTVIDLEKVRQRLATIDNMIAEQEKNTSPAQTKKK